MNNRFIAFFMTAMAFLLCAVNAQAQYEQVGIQRLVNEIPSFSERPVISKDLIVWVNANVNKTQDSLFVYHIPSKKAVIVRQAAYGQIDRDLDVSGLTITFKENQGGVNKIFACRFDVANQNCPAFLVSTVENKVRLKPRIDQDRIVWFEQQSSGDIKLMFCQLIGQNGCQLSVLPESINLPKQPSLDFNGSYIVYAHQYKNAQNQLVSSLRLYDVVKSSYRTLAEHVSAPYFNLEITDVKVDGTTIVWNKTEQDTFGYRMRYLAAFCKYDPDLGTCTYSYVPSIYPSGSVKAFGVYGKYIVFEGAKQLPLPKGAEYNHFEADSNIFIFNMVNNRINYITQNGAPQIYPDIYENRLVWQDYRNSQNIDWPRLTSDSKTWGTQATSTILTWELDPKADHLNVAPVIVATNSDNFKEGSVVSVLVQALDENGDKIRFELDNLPKGAVFQPYLKSNSIYRLTWIPDYNQSGQHIVFILASDGKADTIYSLVLNIKNTNRPPVISATPTQFTVNPGESISLDLVGQDPDGDQLRAFCSKFPGVACTTGVTQIESDGKSTLNINLSFTPNATMVGTEQIISVGAIDSGGARAIKQIKVKVENKE